MKYVLDIILSYDGDFIRTRLDSDQIEANIICILIRTKNIRLI